MLTYEEKKELLKLARTVIESYAVSGTVAEYTTDDPVLKENCGAFVTINKNGRLRGCIGLIEGIKPLADTIAEMAVEASGNDPRFDPVAPGELKEIDIEISVLSPKKRIRSYEEVELGKHGVIVKRGFAGGVFLPQVAVETGWSKEEFMENLCVEKAGLPRDSYKDPKTEIYTFEAEVFGEKEMKKGTNKK
jgi:AmmeMemoRadiSam system protein A